MNKRILNKTINPTDLAEFMGGRPHEPTPRDWQPLKLMDDGIRQQGRRLYENEYYTVTRYRKNEFGGMVVLMIVNADQSAHRDWREFQQIKNELCGEEWEAIELYPAESRKLDPSNAFILYCFKNLPLRLGEYVRKVLSPDESIGPQRRFVP